MVVSMSFIAVGLLLLAAIAVFTLSQLRAIIAKTKYMAIRIYGNSYEKKSLVCLYGHQLPLPDGRGLAPAHGGRPVRGGQRRYRTCRTAPAGSTGAAGGRYSGGRAAQQVTVRTAG